MSIKSNLEQVLSNIDRIKRNRSKTDEITLVAVSKTFPVEVVEEAIEAGQIHFGENKIQEAIDKIPKINTDKPIVWHFIGHLQSNKAKKAVEFFDYIHSIDKYSTAKEINKHSKKQDKTINILIQVNTTGEDSKSGAGPEEVEKLVQEIKNLSNIKLRGFMTMGPLGGTNEEIKAAFRKLKEIQGDMKKKFPDLDLDMLSMGMSSDYEIAIEEGANVLRIGSAVFGSRTYN